MCSPMMARDLDGNGNMTNSWNYRCEVCGRSEALDSPLWRCATCGGAFAIEGPNALSPDRIVRDDPSLWRYQHVLPVKAGAGATLGAGMTPLIHAKLAGHSVRLKLDTLLPTGSFKDRGAALLAAHLRGLGVRRIIVDSSGNAAAAMAGYCAANDLECVVYAPIATSSAKLVQVRAFGAAVHLVEGNRDDVALAAQSAAERDRGASYASHNWHPVFVEGVKTWALEVWEQLGGSSPAAAFIPTGGGSAFVGGRRGFGAVSPILPRLIAAQPAACAPVHAAFQRGADTIEPVVPQTTIAEGTRIGTPARGRQIMQVIRDSGGWSEAVTETEIVDALRELWSQGVYVEPTAAVGAAAFRRAVLDGRELPDGEIVILLTGSGLKATDSIARLLDADALG